MIRTITLILCSGPHLLSLICIFTNPYLNWKEDLFLLALAALYATSLIFKKAFKGLWKPLSIFLLIFLISQFFINHSDPGKLSWWFSSVPGWLSSLIAFAGIGSLVLHRRIRPESASIENPDRTFSNLVKMVAPGMICVSLSLFFLFILNLDELSPQPKLVPDYSVYMIIALGFSLFYLLNFSLKHVLPNSKVSDILLRTIPLFILIFLIGMGAGKIYLVYAKYDHALHSRPEEKIWHDLLDLNRIPRIESIEKKALTELAKISREKGDFKQAAICYERILAGRAFDFEANLGLAEIAYEQKEWRGACESYKRAIYLRPKKKEFYFPYIHSCIKSGRTGEVMEFILTQKENYPTPIERKEIR